MPRHLRILPFYADLRDGDIQNDARCSKFGKPICSDTYCPRHRPVEYAQSMARHAPDSIGQWQR